MLRSSRSRFISGPHKTAYETIVTSAAFEEATLAALLEFQADLPLVTTPNQAADCHNMMVGARRFLDILCTIHQPQTESKPTRSKELNWEAGV